MMWKRKKRSRMRAVQMDNLRGLLNVRRRYRIPNDMRGVKKGVNERYKKMFYCGLDIKKVGSLNGEVHGKKKRLVTWV